MWKRRKGMHIRNIGVMVENLMRKRAENDRSSLMRKNSEKTGKGKFHGGIHLRPIS